MKNDPQAEKDPKGRRPGPSLSKTDIDQIRDLAFALEEKAPFEAYSLFRLVRKYRPNAPVLRRRVDMLEQRCLQDTVVAWRPDGTCERLNAILVGYFIARTLGLEFRFFWPGTDAIEARFGIQHGQGHSIPEETGRIFSRSFIADFQISESDLLTPINGFWIHNPALLGFTLDRFDKLDRAEPITRPCWLAPLRVPPDLADRVGTDDFRAFFRDALFSDAIRAEFAAVEALNLPEKLIGIHYRGGDVIYDGARFLNPLRRVKSISLAAAEALCRHYDDQGYTVLVFGATKPDLDYLARKYENVLTVDDLGLDEVDLTTEVIRDVWLMSQCERMIASKNSGVPILASVVGRVRLWDIEDALPPDQEYQASLDSIRSADFPGFHAFQQAYVHYALFVTAPEQTDTRTLYRYLQDAHACDPENLQYLLLCLITAYILGDAPAVDAFREKLDAALPFPLGHGLDTPRLLSNYVPQREPAVQRLMKAVATQGDAPENVKAFARVWSGPES